ncbi:transcriptional regulator [Dryocola sp. LX212]
MLKDKLHIATPLEKAVFAVGGKQKVLAELLGLSAQAITQTKKRGGKLPLRWMREVIEVTGLSKEDLYPDTFPNSRGGANAS